MLNDLFSEFDDLLYDVQITEGFLDSVERAYAKALEAKSNIDRRVSQGGDRERELLNGPIFNSALDETFAVAPSILTEEIERAAESTEEYSDPVLLAPLLDAANSTNNFRFLEHRMGEASNIAVEINMDETAGSLEQWGEAVLYVREAILQSKNDSNPLKASAYWRMHVYGKDSYLATIEDRLAAAGAIAPYWELLDSGNISTGLSSDWGGSPYPTNGPTRFTDRAARRIQTFFRESFRRFRDFYTREIGYDEGLISKLDYYIEKLEELMDQLRNVDLEKVQEIIRYYDSINRSIDPEKLLRAIKDMTSGSDKTRFELTSYGEVRTRIRAGRLARFIGES